MQITELHADAGQRTFAVILDTGDEAIASLREVAKTQGWTTGRFTAIGAFSRAVIAYFDWDTKSYLRIPIDEQVEVLTLSGDVSVDNGAPKVHAHVVLGTRDGSARGGHLLEGHVRPTLEVMVIESTAQLIRRRDPISGLDLIRDARAD